MKFRMKRGQSVRRVVRKLFAFHLERCRVLLSAVESSPGRIHEVRKSVKRLRALVSLMGAGLGDDRGWFDRRLRDVNRALSPVRDAESLHEAFDRLALTEESPPDEFAVVRAALLSWSEQHERLPAEMIGDILEQVGRLQRRWKQAHLRGRGWSLLEDNVRLAYRRCRAAVRKLPSQPDAAELHEFRKRVKQTQYHWEFLQPICPSRMQPEVETLESLSDALGRHHDCEMLKMWIARQARHVLSERTRNLVVRRLNREQHDLERSVLAAAPTLFAVSSRRVCRRLHANWKAWRRGDAQTRPRRQPHDDPSAVLQSAKP